MRRRTERTPLDQKRPPRDNGRRDLWDHQNETEIFAISISIH